MTTAGFGPPRCQHTEQSDLYNSWQPQAGVVLRWLVELLIGMDVQWHKLAHSCHNSNSNTGTWPLHQHTHSVKPLFPALLTHCLPSSCPLGFGVCMIDPNSGCCDVCLLCYSIVRRFLQLTITSSHTVSSCATTYHVKYKLRGWKAWTAHKLAPQWPSCCVLAAVIERLGALGPTPHTSTCVQQVVSVLLLVGCSLDIHA